MSTEIKSELMEMTQQVRRLVPKNGDILLFTGFKQNNWLAAQHIQREYRNQGLFNPLVVFVKPGQTIDQLDETTMERYGWVRKEKTQS